MSYFWIAIFFAWLSGHTAICQSLLSDSLKIQMTIPQTIAEQSEHQEPLLQAQEAVKQIENTRNTTQLLKAYIHLGNTYKQMGLYKQAIQNFESALQIAKDHHYTDEDLTIIRQLILLHLAENNIIKALMYAEEEKELYEKRNIQHGLVTSLCVLGDIYIKVKKYKEAFVVLNQAYQMAKKEGNAELEWKAILELTDLHIQLQDGEHAILWIQKAMSLATSENPDNLVEYYLLQSKAYHLNKQIDKAVESASFALDKASIGQSKKAMAQAVLQLAHLYECASDYQAALRYHKIYAQIEGSLYTYDLYKNIEQLQIKLETQAKDQKIEMLTKEADFARYQTIVGSLAFALVSVLLFFSYNAYRGKKQSEKQLMKAYTEMQIQNQEILRQNTLIANRNKVIAQTVQYAKRVQQYVYSGQPNYFKVFNRTFICDIPVETISGDFYWTTYRTDSFILVFADCPEHDVAGAFNTIIISTLAAQVIQENNYRNPSGILQEIDNRMKKLQLPNERYSINAGVKLGICTINVHNKRLIFAGAQVPLYYIHQNQLHYIVPDKHALGRKYHHRKPDFQNHIFTLAPQDKLWLISDGYASQFGGKPQPTRLGTMQLRKYLQDIASLNLQQQGERLIEHFNLWKGTNKQTDDVLLFGIEI